MPLVIVGPTSFASIEDRDERIFSDLGRELGLSTPQCDRVSRDWYANPRVDTDHLRAELAAIRDAYHARRREELIRERQIRARDAAIVDQILAPMLATDPVLAKCDELIAVCDEGMAAGQGVRFDSD